MYLDTFRDGNQPKDCVMTDGPQDLHSAVKVGNMDAIPSSAYLQWFRQSNQKGDQLIPAITVVALAINKRVLVILSTYRTHFKTFLVKYT
ncbi:hypothetical protein EVAR_95180_1 [Eumeta japonica]|uniref:Uncharacterized protein n=1 Tax=Eumeta variegata TaxID=151549 RepID=A0A4C1VJG1_EUMVA|nr:hypothetical protein EVAR_95180_1 [Eumeta japonica]